MVYLDKLQSIWDKYLRGNASNQNTMARIESESAMRKIFLKDADQGENPPAGKQEIKNSAGGCKYLVCFRYL
jgi:hypothetical protein